MCKTELTKEKKRRSLKLERGKQKSQSLLQQEDRVS